MSDGQLLIFGGTSEGRELAERLDRAGCSAVVFVATEYGREVLSCSSRIQVRVGRLDEEQMEAMLATRRPIAVVDATHPYAREVTVNLRAACEKTGTLYLRLARESEETDLQKGVTVFDDCASAADYLEVHEGRILLTTGLKELPVFAERILDRSRIYARVLLQEGLFEVMDRYGLSKKQLICMQGPFTEELNAAMLRQLQASYLVTKESGTAGGFSEKVEAAKQTGAVCVVIRRPGAEQGYDMETLLQRLAELTGAELTGAELTDVELTGTELSKGGTSRSAECEAGACEGGAQGETAALCRDGACAADIEPVPEVVLTGIGMGAEEQLTLEAQRAFFEADCIIGAERMLQTLKEYKKPKASMYQAQQIADYIRTHPQYRRFAVALSGDVGFYSGAKRLLNCLSGMRVRLICGISSVQYFAARLQLPWEDMVLMSSHGRQQNLIAAVQRNPRVFTLASDLGSVVELLRELIDSHLSETFVRVGVNLSYPTEALYEGTAGELLARLPEDAGQKHVCVLLIEHAAAVSRPVYQSIPDDALVRGNVPMTKEEVRSVIIAKLGLKRHALVYDIGAGTGSVSVECARLADCGAVYAIERNPAACSLIEANREKFAVPNLHVIEGSAPEALRDLPAPTHVFIGGSGGTLRESLLLLRRRNPFVRIVISCITLETLSEVTAFLREERIQGADICCVTVARAREAGAYHLMSGQNPVYIVTWQQEKV